MGGFGSGRSGGRPTTSDGLTLDLAKLLRDRLFRPGQAWGGSLVWTNTTTGARVGSITYQAHLGADRGRVRLLYTSTNHWNGEKRDSDYWIELDTTPQPFGGHRWWFRCPRTGVRVAKLYLPPGAYTFASRQTYGLAYQSQRQTPYDRALGQAFKRRRRLGDHEGGIGDYLPKPKGMRWKTYDRQMARIEADEAIIDAHLVGFLARIGK
jgi:hypothetical protein